ncbi:MAG: competence/damage-inducible protein A [Bacteroidota bacterium]
MSIQQVNAAIITIGDEILIGQITNTNSAWLGQELGNAGIRVNYCISVGDRKEHIIHALIEASKFADIIITTGGLGPTKDDITKFTFCEYFDTTLVENEEVKNWVTKIFRLRKLPIIQSNLDQALVPKNCKVLFNRSGTAPGMWFAQQGKVYISMPGVPFEMKTIFTEEALPLLKQNFTLPFILHRTILTACIGESFLAKKIATWESNLPPHIQLAYLPSVGQVRLRLSGYSSDEHKLTAEMNEHINLLYTLAGEYIYGEENDSLQQAVGKLLLEHKQTLCTAESCTGGYLAHLITSVPGSSAYYNGSIISYANEIKVNELGVDPQILATDGAVSEACVRQMAEAAREKLNTDYAIATSGIAGPSGGSDEKPVGTVWIAVSNAQQTVAKQFNMGDSRERTILRTALQGLFMLRSMILSCN